MSDAQRLVSVLNVACKAPQFSYKKARAAARQDSQVDWDATKRHNADFNPDVDGCETFVMRDGSFCEWMPSRNAYAPRAPAGR
jgi:hypothetical protein